MDNKYVVLEEKTVKAVEVVLIGEKDEPLLRVIIENELFLPFVVSEVTRASGKKVAVNEGMPRTFDDLLAAESVLTEQEAIIEGLKAELEKKETEQSTNGLLRMHKERIRALEEELAVGGHDGKASLRIAELEEICEERAKEIKRLKNPQSQPMTVVQATSGTLEEIEGEPSEPPRKVNITPIETAPIE